MALDAIDVVSQIRRRGTGPRNDVRDPFQDPSSAPFRVEKGGNTGSMNRIRHSDEGRPTTLGWTKDNMDEPIREDPTSRPSPRSRRHWPSAIGPSSMGRVCLRRSTSWPVRSSTPSACVPTSDNGRTSRRLERAPHKRNERSAPPDQAGLGHREPWTRRPHTASGLGTGTTTGDRRRCGQLHRSRASVILKQPSRNVKPAGTQVALDVYQDLEQPIDTSLPIILFIKAIHLPNRQNGQRAGRSLVAYCLLQRI